MSKSRKQPEQPKAVGCPKCGSPQVSGLMASFYVPLTPDGEADGNWNDWSSESELTPRRLCGACGHEWESEE